MPTHEAVERADIHRAVRNGASELSAAIAAGDKAESARLLAILRSLVRAAVTA